jgi:Flp pilus assembly protein TadG
MKLKLICDDTRGGALVEATVTIPLFLSVTFGLVQAGLLLWSQSGLQHGVELAARCASVNYSANQLGLNTSCFTDSSSGVPTPSTVIADTKNTYIEQYVAQNSFQCTQPGAQCQQFYKKITFTIGTPATGAKCGTYAGYSVQANYSFPVILIFSVPLTAKSCFPVNVS